MRVIAGSAKGRKLRAPKGLDTRPMTGRAREGLFSSLGNVQRHEVLDLYAGSGSLGIEALSRGICVTAVFVEASRRAVGALEATLEACGLEAEVLPVDVGRAVKALAGRSFGLVFVDPPFQVPAAEVSSLLADLVTLLRPGATVVLHRRTGDEEVTVPPQLAEQGHRSYGDSTLWRYETS